MKVGFIGLGIMGKPMCKNLMKAGYEMVVTTHNKETLKEMEALGAKTVTCGREVAEEADVIITMLPNSPTGKRSCTWRRRNHRGRQRRKCPDRHELH